MAGWRSVSSVSWVQATDSLIRLTLGDPQTTKRRSTSAMLQDDLRTTQIQTGVR